MFRYMCIFPNKVHILSREWILSLTTLLSPTGPMIAHGDLVHYIILIIVEMNIWITRKMHFPVVVFFWLISGSISESEGVSCQKEVIITIRKWSHPERGTKNTAGPCNQETCRKRVCPFLSSSMVFHLYLFVCLSLLSAYIVSSLDSL